MSDQTPPDSWPTPEDETVVRRDETHVGGTPPPAGPPPPDRRIGAGMLLGIGVLVLIAAGILIAYLLTHRNNDQQSTTVVVTTAPSTVPATTTGTTTPTTTAATTTARSTTTAPTTTAPTTTVAAPAQPTTATVPDVSGQKEAAAVTALGNAGILASIVFVPGTDPLGAVIGQAKPAGTTVPFHSHVQINISRGPNATTDATVPNVIGQTLEQAVGTLNGAHLRLIYLKYPVTSRTQAGKVVQQSPLSGARAPQNAQVVVYLGAFK